MSPGTDGSRPGVERWRDDQGLWRKAPAWGAGATLLLDRDSAAMRRWPVKGLPSTFVVDRRGRLALRAIGGREFDDAAIVAQLRGLLRL